MFESRTDDDPRTPEVVRVLIVDDQQIVRAGLRVLLSEDPALEVVGEAGSGNEAISVAEAVRPDVVLMDVRMPDGDGIEATRVLTQQPDPVPVLLVTTFDLHEHVRDGLDAGASGFMLKSSTADELVVAVRAAARGVHHIDTSLTKRMLAQETGRSEPPDETARARAAERNRTTAPETPLSPREEQIIALLVTGATNAAIAEHLGLSPGTIKTYLQRVQNKIGANGRAALVAWAFRTGRAK